MPKLIKRFDFVSVAIDVVIAAIDHDKLKVVLLKPQNRAFLGDWALPGGMVNLNESLDDAVKRHLMAKVGINKCHFEQLYAFGDVNRDPFGRVISVAYLALFSDTNSIKLQKSPFYESIAWHPVDHLPKLAYDHKKIMNCALQRLKAKITYSDIIKELLPKEFTAKQLQSAYITILGKKINKTDFINNMLKLKMIKQIKKGIANKKDATYEFLYSNKKITKEITTNQIIN